MQRKWWKTLIHDIPRGKHMHLIKNTAKWGTTTFLSRFICRKWDKNGKKDLFFWKIVYFLCRKHENPQKIHKNAAKSYYKIPWVEILRIRPNSSCKKLLNFLFSRPIVLFYPLFPIQMPEYWKSALYWKAHKNFSCL